MVSDDRTDGAECGALAAFGEHLDPALVVVTTTDGRERAGCLVGFHTQCSIAPDRYAVWLSKANHTYRVALFADHAAVHLLSADDFDLAELFGGTTGDQVDAFAACAWTAGPNGVPLLDRLPNRLVGRRVSLVDDGDSDHVCLTLAPEVVETAASFSPLRLSAVAGIVPGHDAEERPVGDARRVRPDPQVG